MLNFDQSRRARSDLERQAQHQRRGVEGDAHGPSILKYMRIFRDMFAVVKGKGTGPTSSEGVIIPVTSLHT